MTFTLFIDCVGAFSDAYRECVHNRNPCVILCNQPNHCAVFFAIAGLSCNIVISPKLETDVQVTSSLYSTVAEYLLRRGEAEAYIFYWDTIITMTYVILFITVGPPI